MPIDKLIAEVTSGALHDAASTLLRRALTLDGRIAWDDALAPLSPAERYACARVSTAEATPSHDNGNFTLAFRPHGRLYLLPRENFTMHGEALALLCHLDLPNADLERYRALRDSSCQELEQQRDTVCDDLATQGVERVAAEVAFTAEHMAPVIFYVGDRCVSNFYNVGKSGFALETTLSDALAQVVRLRERADIEILTAVHCLHLMLCSGSYTRLEELNATQLSRRAVEEFFEAKRLQYADVCDVPAEYPAASLRERAALLAGMRESIAKRHRFIRLISGTNLRKREGILRLPPAAACGEGVAPTLSEDLVRMLQPCMPEGTSAHRLFGEDHFAHLLGPALVPQDERPFFSSGLEYVIDRVVAEAIRSTGSDIGMTRSIRDYGRFADVLQARQTAVACGWSQAEYFCHVVAGASLLATLSGRALFATLNAISARMRFNSWHYMPSYFEEAEVPASRGWFTAPRMADIADDSDQHHTGHVHAAVRYSIRSPLPLRVGARVVPGLIDLRLMRQSGDPYREEDLRKAIAYTEILQFAYQHLMNHVSTHGAGFAFRFGDKAWFDARYASRSEPRAIAGAGAIVAPPLPAPGTPAERPDPKPEEWRAT